MRAPSSSISSTGPSATNSPTSLRSAPSGRGAPPPSTKVVRSADAHRVCASSPAMTFPLAASVRGCASPAAFGESAISTRSAANRPAASPSARARTSPVATIRRGTSFFPTGSASTARVRASSSKSGPRASTSPSKSAPRNVPSASPVPGTSRRPMRVAQETRSGFVPAAPITIVPGPSLVPVPAARSRANRTAFIVKSGVSIDAGSAALPATSIRSTPDSSVARAATMVASARESSIRAGRPVATRRTPSGVASVGVPSGAGVITSLPVNDTVTTSSSEASTEPNASPRRWACRGPTPAVAAAAGCVPSIAADAIPSPDPRRIQNTASTRSPVTRETRPSSVATMSTESNIESWKSRAMGAAGAACAITAAATQPAPPAPAPPSIRAAPGARTPARARLMRIGASVRSITSRSMSLPSDDSVSESPSPSSDSASPRMRKRRSHRTSPVSDSNDASGASTVISGVSDFRSTARPSFGR